MLPNLIIIGAKKCATTSLHYYLSLHPDIFMSAHKELNFFVKGAGWEKGVAWYEKQFPVPAKVRGESSPNYTQFPMFGGVPERMHQVIPGAKLIYVLRDPVEQIISAYLQDVKAGIESRTLEEIIKTDSEQTPYIYSARYYFQVEQFLKYYPLARFLIIASEDLKTNAAGVMRQIFGFLGVNPDFTSGEFYTLKNVEGELVKRKQSKLERFAASREGRSDWLAQTARAVLPVYLKLRKRKTAVLKTDVSGFVPGPAVREKLRALLKEDVQNLRTLTGQSFPDWSA